MIRYEITPSPEVSAKLRATGAFDGLGDKIWAQSLLNKIKTLGGGLTPEKIVLFGYASQVSKTPNPDEWIGLLHGVMTSSNAKMSVSELLEGSEIVATLLPENDESAYVSFPVINPPRSGKLLIGTYSRGSDSTPIPRVGFFESYDNTREFPISPKSFTFKIDPKVRSEILEGLASAYVSTAFNSGKMNSPNLLVLDGLTTQYRSNVESVYNHNCTAQKVKAIATPEFWASAEKQLTTANDSFLNSTNFDDWTSDAGAPELGDYDKLKELVREIISNTDEFKIVICAKFHHSIRNCKITAEDGVLLSILPSRGTCENVSFENAGPEFIRISNAQKSMRFEKCEFKGLGVVEVHSLGYSKLETAPPLFFACKFDGAKFVQRLGDPSIYSHDISTDTTRTALFQFAPSLRIELTMSDRVTIPCILPLLDASQIGSTFTTSLPFYELVLGNKDYFLDLVKNTTNPQEYENFKNAMELVDLKADGTASHEATTIRKYVLKYSILLVPEKKCPSVQSAFEFLEDTLIEPYARSRHQEYLSGCSGFGRTTIPQGIVNTIVAVGFYSYKDRRGNVSRKFNLEKAEVLAKPYSVYVEMASDRILEQKRIHDASRIPDGTDVERLGISVDSIPKFTTFLKVFKGAKGQFAPAYLTDLFKEMLGYK